MFSDDEFLSAKEKELVLEDWEEFIDALMSCDFLKISLSDYGAFPVDLAQPFTDRLYQYLILYEGFTAQYNRWEFLSCRFGDEADLTETISRMLRWSVTVEKEDIHNAMAALLSPNRVKHILDNAAKGG